MGRNVGRHADRDPGGSIDQQIGDSAGKDDGFLVAAVIVVFERDGASRQVGQHLGADPSHPALGVTHGGGVVGVDRTEVSVAVDEAHSHGERLSQSNHGVVNTAVTMRVIVTHDLTDNGRRFSELGRVGQVLLVHRVQNSALNRLEPIADIGQGSAGDDRQAVVQVSLLSGQPEWHAHDLVGIVIETEIKLCFFPSVAARPS